MMQNDALEHKVNWELTRPQFEQRYRAHDNAVLRKRENNSRARSA